MEIAYLSVKLGQHAYRPQGGADQGNRGDRKKAEAGHGTKLVHGMTYLFGLVEGANKGVRIFLIIIHHNCEQSVTKRGFLRSFLHFIYIYKA